MRPKFFAASRLPRSSQAFQILAISFLVSTRLRFSSGARRMAGTKLTGIRSSCDAHLSTGPR